MALLAQEMNDPARLVYAYTQMVIPMLRVGSMAQAERKAKLALEAGMASGETRLIAEGHTILGRYYLIHWENELAKEHALEGLRLSRQFGYRSLEARCLQILSSLETNWGNFPAAFEFGQSSVAIAREVGDRVLEGKSLNNLALACSDKAQQARVSGRHP